MERDTVQEVGEVEIDGEYVYNIQIQDNKNYFANGILVHNCDDPLNPQSSPSEVEIKSANEWVDWVSTTRVIDAKVSAFILVMQRLNQSDPTGHLLSNKERQINHICLPAEISSDVKPIKAREYYVDGLLDPERLGVEQLNKKRVGLGSLGYAGQYLQTPLPPEGSIIKKEWFKRMSRTDFVQKIKTAAPTINYYLDTAYTEDKSNDPSVIFATCFVLNQLYIIDVSVVRMEFPELLKHIPAFVQKNGHDARTRIFIEPKASGKSIAPQLKQNTMFNVFYSKPPTDSKLSRVTSISPFVEGGRVTIVEGDWNNSFIDELATFPNAKHDDQADCLVMAIEDSQKAATKQIIY